jgi:hypothetical protein
MRRAASAALARRLCRHGMTVVPRGSNMSKTICSAGARLALGCLIAVMACGVAIAGDEFSPCADAALPGLAGSLCATHRAPLRPNDPDTRAVELFIRKFPSTRGVTTGQVWLVAGGPGESGASFYPFLDVFRAAFPGRDLMIPDHRGTGYSTRLCPAEEDEGSPGGRALAGAEWGSCIGGMYADRDRTQAFTVTNASHDLAALITRYRTEGPSRSMEFLTGRSSSCGCSRPRRWRSTPSSSTGLSPWRPLPSWI